MQVKDFVDLFTSAGQLLVGIATFLVALAVAITTARSGRDDELRTLRSQLTDTFNQIFATALQVGQQQQAYGDGNFLYTLDTSTVLNQQYFTLLVQATFLVNKIEKRAAHRATFLAKKIENLVTPVEYNTLAVAYANHGEFQLANTYAERAIKTCDKDDLRLIASATGSYAMILFMQSSFGDGNAKFLKVVDLLEKNATLEKNYANFLKGQIYMQWAMYEKQWAAPGGTPDEHFKDAEDAFHAIEVPLQRERALQVLNEAKKATATAPLPNIGQVQAVQMQQSIFKQMRTPGGFQNS